ncbi:MAG: hypothetical protein R2703_16165 [Micropruina glycogenica]
MKDWQRILDVTAVTDRDLGKAACHRLVVQREILHLIAAHRSASPEVLLLVRDGIVRQLQAGARPYAAGRALAETPEIPITEVSVLTDVPGGSTRFRRALRETMDSRQQRENALEARRG